MKKIMLLGGSLQQIPAIEYSKKMGYETILCDYLVDNPGQYVADKFYNVSTTDKDLILDISKKERIDGIVAYASDPAAPTAAYVAEKLNLPTNPFKSVEILAYKDKFREFLQENSFNSPKSGSYNSYETLYSDIEKFSFPVLIKPTDSSGSKGIKKIFCISELKSAYEHAINFSRNNIIIVEEFIEKDHDFLVGGDCFVLNGKVEYWGLLSCHRDSKVNPLVPVGNSYPLQLEEDRIIKIKEELQRLFSKLNIKFGCFNLEIIVDKNDDVYFIEVGPRNGGNLIPQFLKLINKIDLVAATIETSMGTKDFSITSKDNSNFYTLYDLNTNKNGLLVDILFKNEISTKIKRKLMYKENGDRVEFFSNSSKALGIIFLEFESFEQQKMFIENPENFIEIIVNEVN